MLRPFIVKVLVLGYFPQTACVAHLSNALDTQAVIRGFLLKRFSNII